MQGDLADVSVDMSGSWYVERGEFVCKNAGLTKSYEPYCEWHGCEHLRLSKPAVRFSLPLRLFSLRVRIDCLNLFLMFYDFSKTIL